MIRVPSSIGLTFRRDPYVLDLLPGNTIYDRVGSNLVFFEKKGSSHEASPPKATRYATVNFKFGTIDYVAPFRVAEGDEVVVEGVDGTSAFGIVSHITTTKPTSASPLNKILRHARGEDRQAQLQCTTTESSTIEVCQCLFESMGVSAFVLDLEWQLDMSALTVYFSFDGSKEEMDAMHSALVDQFGCNVWLLPTSSPMTSTKGSLRSSSNCSVTTEPPEPLM